MFHVVNSNLFYAGKGVWSERRCDAAMYLDREAADAVLSTLGKGQVIRAGAVGGRMQIRSFDAGGEIFLVNEPTNWSRSRDDAVTYHAASAAEDALLRLKMFGSTNARNAEIVARPRQERK